MLRGKLSKIGSRLSGKIFGTIDVVSVIRKRDAVLTGRAENNFCLLGRADLAWRREDSSTIRIGPLYNAALDGSNSEAAPDPKRSN